jgi:hypothetical protein
MSGLAIAAGTTAVIGGAEFISGLESKKKDERELKSLKQPFYNIQSEYYQDRNIAAENAGQGTPAGTKQYETQEAQRGLGTALGDILKGGGDVNSAAMLLSQYNNNIGKIGAADAEQHAANIQYFMNANKDLAGQKTTQWSINELQPYEAKLKELKQNAATDQQNEIGGLTTAVGGVTALGTGGQNAALIKKLMNSGNQQPGLASWTPVGAASTAGAAPSPAPGVNTINPNAGAGVGVQADDDFTNIQGI